VDAGPDQGGQRQVRRLLRLLIPCWLGGQDGPGRSVRAGSAGRAGGPGRVRSWYGRLRAMRRASRSHPGGPRARGGRRAPSHEGACARLAQQCVYSVCSPRCLCWPSSWLASTGCSAEERPLTHPTTHPLRSCIARDQSPGWGLPVQQPPASHRQGRRGPLPRAIRVFRVLSAPGCVMSVCPAVSVRLADSESVLFLAL
jgi:hypothetical protein